MRATAKSRFQSGFRARAASHSDVATSVLVEQRDRALRLLQRSHEEAHRRIEGLVAVHEGVIASMVACHQRELDALQAQLDSVAHGPQRRLTLVPESPGLGSERIGRATAGITEAGSASEALVREQRELRSELVAAKAEIEETRADAIRLQGERDDAVGEADNVRLQILSEIGAARDEAIQVQSQLDEALRMVDDGRDQAREEQWRLIEELDALQQELAACRQELAETRQPVA